MIINFKTALPDIAYCKIDQIIRLIVYIELGLAVHTQEWLLLFHSNQHCRGEWSSCRQSGGRIKFLFP